MSYWWKWRTLRGQMHLRGTLPSLLVTNVRDMSWKYLGSLMEEQVSFTNVYGE